MRLILAGVWMVLAATPLPAAAPIAGRWVTADKAAVVEIARCGQTLCGRIARILIATPGAPAADVANPDAALRKRAILGLPILTGFVDRGGDWRGLIYDPRRGKTYKSIVRRDADGTLKVQGCIAVFCQTQRWTPAP